MNLFRRTNDDSAHDAAIDSTLRLFRSVPVPEGLNDRLQARLAEEGATGTTDARINAALGLLGRVQPSPYMNRRIHARLAQEPIAAPERSAVRGWAPWAALGTVAAGLVLAVTVHSGTPAKSPAQVTKIPAAVAARPIVHPAFLPGGRTGSGAALNANGAIATARAKQQHAKEDARDAKNGIHRNSRVARAVAPRVLTPAPGQDSSQQR